MPRNNFLSKSILYIAYVHLMSIIDDQAGERDEALKLVREAIEHGLRSDEHLAMENDPDLKSLHGDPRLALLVAESKERAAALAKPNR